MSDRWETVQGPKKPRKPKPSVQSVNNGRQNVPGATGIGKPQKAKKHSAKTPANFPLGDYEEEILAEETVINPEKKKTEPKKKSKSSNNNGSINGKDKQPKEKRRDLEGTLKHLNSSELLQFFQELQNAGGSSTDVCLSWIKYSADALNTTLNRFQPLPPDVNQWPNDLSYPQIPEPLEQVIRTIISETSQTKEIDVLGLSFSSLLGNIPTLIQRGDPGWGYLIFLRELLRIDPSLSLRRSRSFSELMESFGNRKEIGLCLLWTISQAGIAQAGESTPSPYGLKIASQYLLPYYGFKHYKTLVVSALSSLFSYPATQNNQANMAVDYLIEEDEFEEFFEAAFDPKKKKDLEKIYPRVKELVLKGLKGQGSPIFLKFLDKVGKKEFLPLSPYGKEVFDILLGCIENDASCADAWRANLTKYPKESALFLSHLSKVPDTIQCGSRLESKLIQSDEFAVAAVKNPELLRYAKKVQAGLERVASSKKRRFSWKLAVFFLFLAIGGLFYLDIAENGKGSFEKSNTGKLAKEYGILKETTMAYNSIISGLKYIQEYATLLFRSIYEGILPLLQAIVAKVQEYIPQVTEFLSIIGNFIADFSASLVKYLQTNVFVGSLSPDNLRKLTKDSLSFVWSNVLLACDKVYSIIEKYVS